MNGAKQNYINMQLAVGFSFPWGSGGLRNCILALLFIEVGLGGGGLVPRELSEWFVWLEIAFMATLLQLRVWGFFLLCSCWFL